MKTIQFFSDILIITWANNKETIISYANLRKICACAMCGGESDEGKPHPAPYLNIANKMSLDPSASWAIEDSPNGVRSAGSAGYLVLHVPDQNSPSKDMSDWVWAVYSSLMEITRDINDLESNSSI